MTKYLYDYICLNCAYAWSSEEAEGLECKSCGLFIKPGGEPTEVDWYPAWTRMRVNARAITLAIISYGLGAVTATVGNRLDITSKTLVVLFVLAACLVCGSIMGFGADWVSNAGREKRKP